MDTFETPWSVDDISDVVLQIQYTLTEKILLTTHTWYRRELERRLLLTMYAYILSPSY